jgi:methenyltetrahydrofolate cyclohydrolase
MSVRELLEALGSSTPAPGGGAAAALVGALGAALVQMTANLTLGRPRFAEVQDQSHSLANRARALVERLAALGDADTDAFAQVTAAYRLPRDNELQRLARTAAIEEALQAAAQVPLETAQACAGVLDLAEEAAPLLNPAVISDVVVGALLALSALESAAINVEINIATMSDRGAGARLEEALAHVRAGSDQRLARIVDVGRGRFPSRKG